MLFFICVPAWNATLFSPRKLYLTGVSGLLTAPSLTNLPIIITNVLQSGIVLKRDKHFLIDEVERGQQPPVLNSHHE